MILQINKEQKIETKEIIDNISNSCINIRNLLSKYNFQKIKKKAENPSGDISLEIDFLAQDEIVNNLKNLTYVYAVISEEEEKPIILNSDGKYIIAIDPLDGSSNVKINGLCGTIFSILERKSIDEGDIYEEDFLQQGKKQLSAGYALYSNSLIFGFVYENAFNLFQYNDSEFEYFELINDYKMKNKDAKFYSINEAYIKKYNSIVQNYIDFLKKEGLTARYSGALVADFHRILINGGVFLYPGTKDNPEGKLRLLFECNPLALILQTVNGTAINGSINILNIIPKSIHQKTPFFIGSKYLIEKFISQKNS